MLFYPATLPLSHQTLTYTAGIIRRHRKQNQVALTQRKLAPAAAAPAIKPSERSGLKIQTPPTSACCTLVNSHALLAPIICVRPL